VRCRSRLNANVLFDIADAAPHRPPTRRFSQAMGRARRL